MYRSRLVNNLLRNLENEANCTSRHNRSTRDTVAFPILYDRPHPKYDECAHPLPSSPIKRHWPFAPGAGTFAEPENPWASWVY
ncbi:hypothetical protein BT67DRAFT_440511 [Trichocladium antarcticum]|uniref:Uncharacterized protein n=1 Tax=Trichocladium antarcticum TaxID=1450529 RepID=A0AAN6ZFJ2_9PEZI|nr:hypothetical protein BT67DRAFT_440511 [Trichocladium antarcticum]